MKAHVVKWGMFLSFVFLLAAFLRGRGCHGWLEDQVLVSPFFSAFVFRPGAALDVLSS
jgi:hypothetical protein